MIRERNQPDPNNRSCLSDDSFCKALLNFIRPSENEIFNIHGQISTKLLTRLTLGFSHLREHKFWHYFEDTLSSLCSCSNEAETMLHLFLRCQFFDDIREILIYDWMNIYRSLSWLSQDKLISVLLYGNDAFDSNKNRNILICTVHFIKDSHKFGNSLF